MIALLAAFALAPDSIAIATPRGEVRVPVAADHGIPAVAAPLLAAPLGLTITRDGAQARIDLDGVSFELYLGLPFARAGGAVCALAGGPYAAGDTLYLPLPFVADCVPSVLGARFHWEAERARLVETPPVTAVVRPRDAGPPNPVTGLRLHHVVAIDAGHGGVDPGNPGLYLPRGVDEKDITLAIARLLKAELLARGIGVIMTRTTDTLIDLHDRPAYCVDACDLFVSIHVNSMDPGPNRRRAHGIETYFLSDAKTEDAARVARMENDAIRYEHGGAPVDSSHLGFILKDLAQNEYLRESARLATLIDARVAAVAPGGDRGVQQAPFWVLKDARRPAVLVETGFATNRADARYLASPLGQHQIARAIADGIVAYLVEFERKLAVAPAAGAAGP